MSGFLPMLFVEDVEASSRWYQELFGLTSGHGGPEFEMLMSGDTIAMQLHLADAEEHGTRVHPDAPTGSGVLLNFETVDVEAVHRRAVEMGAAIETEPAWNELASHTEFVVLDPNGYALCVHTPFDPTR